MTRPTRGGAGWLLLVLTTTVLACTSVQAQAQVPAGSFVLAQSAVDLKQAARIAQKAYGGEVVKADELVQNGQRLFQIRLVNNGRVRDVLVDAATGRILNP